MLYLVHRTSNPNNTVFRYINDLKVICEEKKIEYRIISDNEIDNKSSSVFLDLFFKNINYVKFLFKVLFFFLFKFKRNDKIMITSDPPYFYLILYITSFFRKNKIVIWWQDIFPETLSQNKILIIFFNIFRSRVIKKYKNIFISPDQLKYIQTMVSGFFDYKVIPNWSFYKYSKQKLKLDKKIKFGYLGNISISHNIFKLINDFQNINFEFEFFISKRKRYKNELEIISKDKRFILVDHLSDKNFINFIKKIDVCIVSEKFNQNKYLFPSKAITYFYMNKFIFYHGNKNSFLYKILSKYKNYFFINTFNDFKKRDYQKLENKFFSNIETNNVNIFQKNILIKKLFNYLN